MSRRALVCLSLLACGPGKPDTGEPVDYVLTPQIEASPEVPTVLHVTWSTKDPGESWIEYGLEELDQQTPIAAESSDHSLAVLGLKAGRTYSVRAVTIIDGKRFASRPQTIDIASVPDWYGSFEITSFDAERAEMSDGYLLVGVATALAVGFADVGAHIAILDADGDYVWFHDLSPGLGNISPSVTRGGILWDEYDSFVVDDLAWASLLDITGYGPIVRTRLEEGHHVAIETKPDTLAFVARDIRTIQIGNDDVVVQTDRIRETDLGTDQPPRDLFDLFDELEDNFHWPCVHTLTAGSRTGYPELFEWTHGNSLIYQGNALYMYTRWTDTLYKVDPVSGFLHWQLGGPDSDFTLPSGDPVWSSATDSKLWSHGHLSQLWDGGFVLFDNGSHSTPRVSGIAEYRLDEAARTVEEVFRFDDPNSRFMGAVGDARKLPGGNYMASWTTWGEITEITPTGEIVWKAKHSDEYATTRVQFIEDLYALADEQRRSQ